MGISRPWDCGLFSDNKQSRWHQLATLANLMHCAYFSANIQQKRANWAFAQLHICHLYNFFYSFLKIHLLLSPSSHFTCIFHAFLWILKGTFLCFSTGVSPGRITWPCTWRGTSEGQEEKKRSRRSTRRKRRSRRRNRRRDRRTEGWAAMLSTACVISPPAAAPPPIQTPVGSNSHRGKVGQEEKTRSS